MPVKLQFAESLGNKFIIIDNLPRENQFNIEFIKSIAAEYFIDQIIILENFDGNELKIQIFNHDGSIAEACGNAFRCLGLLIYQNFNCKKFNIINHLEQSFKVEYYDVDNIAITFPLPRYTDDLIDLPYYNLFQGQQINIGNPHLLFKVNNLDLDFLQQYGEEIISLPLFPNKINLSLVKIIDLSNIQIITYERGAGITQACGSGALASSIYARLQHNLSQQINIHMLGGSLTTNWLKSENQPQLIGNAIISNIIIKN